MSPRQSPTFKEILIVLVLFMGIAGAWAYTKYYAQEVVRDEEGDTTIEQKIEMLKDLNTAHKEVNQVVREVTDEERAQILNSLNTKSTTNTSPPSTQAQTQTKTEASKELTDEDKALLLKSLNE